jgi:RNA polymerase sigma-70 factor, ECF subfamily
MYVDAQHINQPLKHPMLATTTGEDVLQRARRGVPDAFAAILREHESRVYSIALRFTGRRSDAEELTQDVFLQLHGALGRMVDSGHLKRWLLRTVTHRCLNRLRNDSRRPKLVPIETLEPASEPHSSELAADPLLGTRLRQLLLQLPADARAVMLLRFQEDLDPSEIASVLEMPVNTVKSHLRRSLDWLRAQCAGDNHGY